MVREVLMTTDDSRLPLSTSSIRKAGLMARIHPDTIQEIKQHVDIVKVLLEHVSLKKSGKEYVGLCPFHDEKTPSFNVNYDKQVYHCFGCGAAGDVIKFLMQLGEHSFADVVQDLGQRYGVSVGDFHQSPSTRLLYPQLRKPKSEPAKPRNDCTVDEVYMQRSHEWLLLDQGEIQQLARNWLKERGFTHAMIQHYQLGLEKVKALNPESQRWETYWSIAIFIPVPARPGRFYQKRRVAPWLTGDERPHYLKRWSQPGVATTVFTTYRHDQATKTYFCEGEWDALALGWLAQCRKEQVAIACSTGGCNTVPPLKELSALPMPLFTFYDRNDTPSKQGLRSGERGARKLVESLKGSGFVAEVPMPSDCTLNGWDVSDALKAGYQWEDFAIAAESIYTVQLNQVSPSRILPNP